MKPALYYSIRNNLHSTIVAVTSEKGLRRWHGRDCRYNEVTHGTFDQLKGRFATLEEAEACRSGIVEIEAKYKPRFEFHSKARNKLYREQADEIEAFIKAKADAT